MTFIIARQYFKPFPIFTGPPFFTEDKYRTESMGKESQTRIYQHLLAPIRLFFDALCAIYIYAVCIYRAYSMQGKIIIDQNIPTHESTCARPFGHLTNSSKGYCCIGAFFEGFRFFFSRSVDSIASISHMPIHLSNMTTIFHGIIKTIIGRIYLLSVVGGKSSSRHLFISFVCQSLY